MPTCSAWIQSLPGKERKGSLIVRGCFKSLARWLALVLMMHLSTTATPSFQRTAQRLMEAPPELPLSGDSRSSSRPSWIRTTASVIETSSSDTTIWDSTGCRWTWRTCLVSTLSWRTNWADHHPSTSPLWVMTPAQSDTLPIFIVCLCVYTGICISVALATIALVQLSCTRKVKIKYPLFSFNFFSFSTIVWGGCSWCCWRAHSATPPWRGDGGRRTSAPTLWRKSCADQRAEGRLQ